MRARWDAQKGMDIKMKKSYLTVSIAFLAAGAVLLCVALLTDSVLDSLLFGFASSMTAVGVANICRYFYWSAPKNAERYGEKLAKEKIEIQDELKSKLRDRAGRYTYLLGLVTICVSIMVFSILGKLEAVGGSRILVLYLGGYLVFQIAAWNVIYRRLLRKY